MHVLKSFILGALVVLPALTSPTEKRIVHEKRNERNTAWTRSTRVSQGHVLPLRFALKQSNLDKGHDWLMDVSHPSSPNYGKHWTFEQVRNAFKPSDETIDAVKEWLANAGISEKRLKLSAGENWVLVDTTTKEAERLLGAEYFFFTHMQSGKRQIACDEYSLPDGMEKHIDFVTPSVHFDSNIKYDKIQQPDEVVRRDILRKRQAAELSNAVQPGIARAIGRGHGDRPRVGHAVNPNEMSAPDTCDQFITPACLEELYNFTLGSESNPGNSYGIVEYTPQSYVPSDLDMFFANFTPNLVGDRPIFDSIDGGVLVESPMNFSFNGESDLDLEYAIALSQPQNITLYQTGDDIIGASFNNFLDALDASYCSFEGGDDPTQDAIYPDNSTGGYMSRDCGRYSPAFVISTSYSTIEPALTPFYAERQCSEYQKLGLMGTTFLYSSGDDGVAGDGQCLNPDGTFNNGTSGMFVPTFPSTCPYVLSVGATQVKENISVPDFLASGQEPEMASETVIFSGGGFSNVFSVPDYQASAVSAWFANNTDTYGPDRFNTSGTSRGFPDVSANGVNYTVNIDSEFVLVYGTSASSPTFGSILTLVNAARLNAGKSSVGFVNPALYENPGVLNDITSGDNPGCGTDGFQAQPGWDPVTGLGTPNFPKMRDLFLSLP